MFPEPAVGMTVQFIPGEHSEASLRMNGVGPSNPMAAIVTKVWSRTLVNLVVFRDGYDGGTIAVTSVEHLSDVDDGGQAWVFI